MPSNHVMFTINNTKWNTDVVWKEFEPQAFYVLEKKVAQYELICSSIHKTMSLNQTDLLLLVIAHPDDECMFFFPTLQHFVKDSKSEIFILCLSNGNYDGLGILREKELKASGKLLGVKESNIHVAHVSELQDHPCRLWDPKIVSDVVFCYLQSLLVRGNTSSPKQVSLITFDSWGVSGHFNHISTFLGVKSLMSVIKPKLLPHKVDGYTLVSFSNFFRKYIPIIFILEILFAMIVNDPRTFRYHAIDLQLAWRCLAAHESQFVWYRKLSIIFSRYTYTNTLLPITNNNKFD